MTQGLKFTREHEWVKIETGTAIVGITDFAQKQLGDVVYVELPEKGRKLGAGEEAAVVESVKAASEIYAPVAGEVIEANAALANEPGKVNEDPMAGGWFFRLKVADSETGDALMDQAAYDAFVSGL